MAEMQGKFRAFFKKNGLSAFLCAVILLLLVYINNDTLVLALHGFNSIGTRELDVFRRIDGVECRVVINERGDREYPQFAVMERSSLGIWRICQEYAPTQAEAYDMVSFYWWEGLEGQISDTYHCYIYGTRSKKQIPSLAAYLPENTVALVTQERAGGALPGGYQIHLIVYQADAEEGFFSRSDLMDLLKALDCIEEG